MAKILTKAGITTGNTVEAFHVTQSIDAFTGIDAYDISLSGSLNVVGLTVITGNTTITGSLNVTGGITGSFTGSFTGDGSQLTGVTSEWDGTHVGNAEITGSLTLTTDLIARNLEPSSNIFLNQNKTLYLDGQSVANQGIYSNLFGNGEVIIYSGSTQLEIGYNGSPQVTITNANLFLAGNVTASSYTGSFVGNGSGLTGIVSSSYAVTASYAENAGADTNFANTDLTFTADRNHDSNGFDFVVTADNGGFNSAYIGYLLQSLMGDVTQSFLGVQNTVVAAEDNNGMQRINLTVDNTSSINITGGATGGVSINGNSLFVSTVTDNVSIGKNTSNAKLDVNGNTIITGSLAVSNSLNTAGAKVRKYRTITLTDADYSTAPSDKINADDDIILVINNTTGAPGVGEANFGISSFLASPSGRCVEIVCIKSGSYGISLSDPDMVGLRLWLNDQSQANGFRQVCSDVGESITLMSYELDASGSAWGNGY